MLHTFSSLESPPPHISLAVWVCAASVPAGQGRQGLLQAAKVAGCAEEVLFGQELLQLLRQAVEPVQTVSCPPSPSFPGIVIVWNAWKQGGGRGD